jgi:Na+/proline symporter
MHAKLSLVDWIVVGAYLGGTTALGLYVSKRVRTSEGFFMGNRAFGKAIMIAQNLGTGTHSDQAVGVAGAAYTSGLSGIWYQWIWLFTTPFYWLLAPVFRRLRMVTIADFFEIRYGRGYSIAYAIFCIYLFALWQGIAIKGTAVTVSAITGIPELLIAIIIGLTFTLYGVTGGLVAAAITDFVQGFLIVLLSFLVVPFGVIKVGGMNGLRHALPDHFFSIFSQSGGELTPFNVAMLVISGLAGIVVQPHMMAVGASGKTEMNCRIGWTYGNFVKRICTVGWTLTGLLAAALFPGIPFHDREKVFGLAVTTLLPSGLIGLMAASLMATVMSTCSAFMVDGSALFTENLYRPMIKTPRSDAHFLKVARISSICIAVLGFVIGLMMSSVISATIQFISILPFIGVAFWIGIIWPRATRAGAWTSTLGSAAIFYATKWAGLANSWSSLCSIATGLILIVSVSFFTPSEPEEKLAQVYRDLRLPIEEQNPLLAEEN